MLAVLKVVRSKYTFGPYRVKKERLAVWHTRSIPNIPRPDTVVRSCSDRLEFDQI